MATVCGKETYPLLQGVRPRYHRLVPSEIRPVTAMYRDPKRVSAFIDDAIETAELTIEQTEGAVGVRLRVGYSLLNRIRPTFIDDNIDRLMPSVAEVLDSHLAQCPVEVGIAEWIAASSAELTERLLGLVDESAGMTSNERTLRVYRRFRPFASTHVSVFVPGLGHVVERHIEPMAP